MKTVDLVDLMFWMEKQASRAGVPHIKKLLKEFDTLSPFYDSYDGREIGRNIEAQNIMNRMSRIVDATVPGSVDSIGQLRNQNAISQYQVMYPKYPTEDLRNYLNQSRKRNKVDYGTNQFFPSRRPMPEVTDSEMMDLLQGRKLQRMIYKNKIKHEHEHTKR